MEVSIIIPSFDEIYSAKGRDNGQRFSTFRLSWHSTKIHFYAQTTRKPLVKDRYKPEPDTIDDPLLNTPPVLQRQAQPPPYDSPSSKAPHGSWRLYLALLILKVGLYIPHSLPPSCLSERWLGRKAPLGCKCLFPSLIFNNVRKN